MYKPSKLFFETRIHHSEGNCRTCVDYFGNHVVALETLVLSFWWCRVERVSGHPRPPSVEALVYRGCPCWDPPVCHRVHDDSVAERQPCACGWCVSCHLVSDFERVCELVLCDGVPHCKTVILQTNCDSCVLWHV